MALWLKDLYQDYITEKLPEEITVKNKNSKPIIGGIYFGSLKSLDKSKENKPLYFIVIDKIDDNLYEVMKVSDWYLFASHSDLIIELNNSVKAIIETSLNFYLTPEEISKFILVDTVSEEVLKEIKNFRDGADPNLLKKGFTPMSKHIDLGDYKDIRDMFKEEEFNQIKQFHTRIFEILATEDE